MKKVICTLLALVMVMSMMVGCGSKEETTTEAPAKEETSAPAEEKKEEAPAEEKKEEAPTEWTEEGYLPFANGETLVIGTSELAVVDNYDTNPMTVWLEEQTGVNIEFMFFPGDAGAKQQTFTLMVAAGEKLPDIIMNGVELTTQMINEYGRDGYIVDLKDYIGDMNYTPYMTQALNKISDALHTSIMIKITDPTTGGIYQAPWASDVVAWDNTQTIGWINQKWLDAVGMKAPTTIDELHDVLVAFKEKDPNGNGKADELPMMGNNGSGGAHMLGYVINPYVYFDFNNHFNATDGQVWAPWASDEYREALKTLNAWYQEGLIAQQCFTGIDNQDAKAILTPEDEVAICGVMCGHPSVYMTKGNAAYLEYVPLETIWNAETDKGGYQVNRPGAVYDGSIITADCENVELALRFLDFFYKDSTVATVRHGYQGTHWEWVDPAETNPNVKNVKVIKNVDDDERRFNWGYNFAISTSNNFMNAVPREGWDGYKDECETQIETWMSTAKVPDEVVVNFVFTPEEQEFYNSNVQLFTDYINESMAKFGTGVWDPGDDAAWETYLGELKAMGMEEYLATAQSGYSKYLEKYGK